MELVLATSNPHKTREFRQLFGNAFVLVDLSSITGIEMPDENGANYEDNAVLKANSISRRTDKLVIADDSGLEVDALDGGPGIYSARYAGEKAGDIAKVEKLLRELRGVVQRSARFRCVIAAARAGKVLGTFEGVVEGAIVDAPRGTAGFGYDPVFQPVGFDQTFAEMAPELKNRISHRAGAVAALREALSEIGN